MGLRRFGLVGLVCALFAWPAEAADDWVTVVPLDGSFTASMPMKPRFIMDDAGKGDYTNMATYIMNRDGRIFAVGYADVKPDAKGSMDQLMETNRNDFVKSIRAKLTGSQPIQFHNAPGDPRPASEFTAVSEKASCKGLIVADGMRIFQVVACTRTGVDAPEDIERMLSSFTIVPRS